MAMERASIRLPLRVLADSASWTLSSWLVSPGSAVYRNQRVAALHSPSTGAVDHALAPRAGTLVKILIAEGASVNAGAQSPADFNRAIAEIEFCPHSVVFSGLCGVCGEEVAVAHFADVQADASTRLPVAYNASTLSVTRAEAESIASVTARQLLSQRRLSLVLDLDHTLVHATDDPRAAAVLDHSPAGTDMSSVASFCLPHADVAAGSGPMDNRMHLKLRPHLFEFLSRCAKLFELHIYTMGSRLYADRVAQLIDPDKRLFSGRITSREDFEEGRSNQKNISRLFPCDDSMVLIIDDREDVWVSGTGASFMPNLIRAKPYTFWNGLHETYDRALSAGQTTLASTPPRSDVPSCRADSTPSALPKECVPEAKEDSSEAKEAAGGAPSEIEKAKTRPTPEMANGLETADKGVVCVREQKSPSLTAVEVLNEEPMPILSEELRKLVNQWWENDSSAGGWNTHLQRLAEVLELCHSRFFDNAGTGGRGAINGSLNGNGGGGPVSYEKDEMVLKIPGDVKSIVAGIRSKVLHGCVITFTGVIALNTPPQESAIWELAVRHGAECRKDFVVGETTHVVASAERGLATQKALSAMESGAAFLVDLSWLEDSSIHFERRPEWLYCLSTTACGSSEEHRRSTAAAFAKARADRQAGLARVERETHAKAGTADKHSSSTTRRAMKECRPRSNEQDFDDARPSKSRRVEKEIEVGQADCNNVADSNAAQTDDANAARILGDEEMDDIMFGLL